MQVREIRTWSTEELQRRLEETSRELFAIRRQKVSGRLENTTRIKAVKRDIAQMKTILRERELIEEAKHSEGAA
jgi:large subunit ribosomal protein L29